MCLHQCHSCMVRIPRDPPAFVHGMSHRNNDNLTRLSLKISSSLIFAHVRAAYPGMPVSEQNCHPFQWKHYMWMHNGNIGGFSKVPI